MKPFTQAQRDGMDCARQCVDTIIRDVTQWPVLHGEALEHFMLEMMMAKRGPVRDAEEAAAVAIAAMALARLVEHERGEREVVA